MARIKLGSIVTDLSGSAGGHTIQNSRSGFILRNKPQIAYSLTPAQYSIRSINKTMQAGWRSLSNQSRKVWNYYATNTPVFNRSGEKHPLSGHSLWIKYQFVYLFNHLPFLLHPSDYESSPLSSQAKALYDAMPTKPDPDRLKLINDFIKSLISFGIWSKLDFLHILSAHAEDSSLLNWVNPGTFKATNIGSTPFEIDRGYTGNGINQYLNSNYIPSVNGINWSLNSASVGVYLRLNINESSTSIGASDYTPSLNFVIIQPCWANRLYLSMMCGDYYPLVVNTDSRGLFISTRVASNHQLAYKAKIAVIDSSLVSTRNMDKTFFILARNNNGSPARHSTNQISLDFAASGFSQTDVNNFYDTVKILLTGIGAFVV